MIKNILLILSFILLIFSCKNSDSNKLRIATSANMQFAINELVDEFSNTTGIECEIITSSSGKLTAQIHEGAPYDVFVSANLKYPNDLFEKGLTLGKPKIYAYGKLVLWTMKDDLTPSIQQLENNQIKHIALANPKTAPYGNASIEVLNHYKIFQKLSPKLVYGESIAQVNQFVNSQVADIGFTSKSVVLSPKMVDKGKWVEVNDSIYQPIAQGIVCIKNGSDKEKLGLKFSDFLFSQKGKEILNTFGYSTDLQSK
ncbi:MAG: molybdate ABC transporter substrate-binding protein [Saprospiraceae bacterium]